MNRREFLAATTTTLTLGAGCTTPSKPIYHDLGEIVDGPWPDNTEFPWRVGVTATYAQVAAFSPAYNDERSLQAADSHFLFADLTVRTPTKPYKTDESYTLPDQIPGSFTAVINGTDAKRLTTPLVPDGQTAYSGAVFEVTAPDEIDETRIEWTVNGETHAWPLSAEGRQTLHRTPNTTDVQLSTSRATAEAQIDVTLTAANSGDRGPIRVLLLTETGLARWFRAIVPKGGTETWQTAVADESGTQTVTARTADGETTSVTIHSQ